MRMLKHDASFRWRAEIIIIEARCNQARDLDKVDLEILILMNNNPDNHIW